MPSKRPDELNPQVILGNLLKNPLSIVADNPTYIYTCWDGSQVVKSPLRDGPLAPDGSPGGCPIKPPPPTLRPAFNGGQCDGGQYTGTVFFTRDDGTKGSIEYQFGGYGPIGRCFVRDTSTGQEVTIPGPNPGFQNDHGVEAWTTARANPTGPVAPRMSGMGGGYRSVVTWDSLTFTRIDGVDNCGDPPPSISPTTPAPNPDPNKPGPPPNPDMNGNCCNEIKAAINQAKSEILLAEAGSTAAILAAIAGALAAILAAIGTAKLSDFLRGLLGDLLQPLLDALPDLVNGGEKNKESLEEILEMLDEIKEAVVVEVKGQVEIDTDCNQETAPILAKYQGKGVAGLKELIEVLSAQIRVSQNQTCDVKVAMKDSAKYSFRNYQVLGGDLYFDKEGKHIGFTSKPEEGLKFAAGQIFSEDGTSQEVKLKTISELISHQSAVNYYRAGYHELPGEVPKSLLSSADKEPPIRINNAIELQEWLIQQIDALVGSWPLEIEIEDADPTEPGNQTKRLKLPNLAETLAELVGISLQGSVNAESAVQVAMRAMVEASAAKNAAIAAQDYGRANADYLGYEGKEIYREVGTSFTPGENRLDKALTPSTQKIRGWEATDKKDLNDYMGELLSAAMIIKAVYQRKVKGDDMTQGIKELLKTGLNLADKALSKNNAGEEDPNATTDFDTFLEEVERGFADQPLAGQENTLRPYGRSWEERPKIREISAEGDQPEPNQ
jgi:hypothetical protein